MKGRGKVFCLGKREEVVVRILLINSEEASCQSLAKLIKDVLPDCSVAVAHSGAEGLRIGRREAPDTILLRSELADGEGRELCRVLKGESSLQYVPVIMLLSGDDEQDRIEALNTGAESLLVEPLKKTELEAQLKAMLRIKQAEDCLRQERDSLEAARHAETTLKDEFLANMSHELRTPLSNILGMSEALIEGVYGVVNKEQLKSLKAVEQSGRQLLALINDILDISRVGAGKLNLELAPVNVRAVCESSLRLVRQRAEEKSLAASLVVDSAVEIVRADERRLKQIIISLLDNAVKFTPTGGRIGLEVVGDPKASKLRLSVWDTGIGISTEDLPHLFKPFVQLDRSLSRPHAGTGLGLALVRSFAELHGGTVSVESHQAKGSRFTIELPWLQPTRALQQEDEGGPFPQRPVTTAASKTLVAIVDDNEDNLDILTRYLEKKRYQVVTAREGRAALCKIQEALPDIVLMDIRLPGMDGLEVIRQIRRISHLQHTPIVAITALATAGDRERCFEAGADEYLSKPLSLKGLVETIERELALKDRRPKGGTS